MLKLGDSIKGEKSFGVMNYEPPYLPAGRQVRDPYVRWCERCTLAILVRAVYSISDWH